jgi:hypothetical protein
LGFLLKHRKLCGVDIFGKKDVVGNSLSIRLKRYFCVRAYDRQKISGGVESRSDSFWLRRLVAGGVSPTAFARALAHFESFFMAYGEQFRFQDH